KKPLLLMTHIVVGYPSFRESWALARNMVDAGVDLMELQIPFSEPMADGPVILKANQDALAAGATVAKCLEFARELGQQVPIPLLFMSYYNILFKHGVQSFAAEMKRAGLAGAIVPDLPVEEGAEYASAMSSEGLAAVGLFAPNTPESRMQKLAEASSGMIYCVARKGVTGAKTDFSTELGDYLARARRSTSLPLAVGFGLKNKSDVDFVRGKADVAIVGSESIRVLNESGVRAVGDFIKTLAL
ncbi:MAG TPA: tryptophan synthase subunit alpha, partial [Polyangiaceae bacterium]|nr:tryptophan synthase subunit alpha [Polyangiaceae bacterium]